MLKCTDSVDWLIVFIRLNSIDKQKLQYLIWLEYLPSNLVTWVRAPLHSFFENLILIKICMQVYLNVNDDS